MSTGAKITAFGSNWAYNKNMRSKENVCYCYRCLLRRRTSLFDFLEKKTFILLSFADNSGPIVVYCPPDQNITATSMKTTVTWQSPQFKDNSNSPLVVRCSQESGTEFYWGTWNVHCTAYDNNPNNKPALCQFKLRLKRKYCITRL